MLQTFIATNEHHDAYLRPAIYDSLKAVLAFYKLESAAQIYYNGGTDVAKLVGTNRSDGPTADRFTDGTFRNKVFIVPDVQRSEFWSNRVAMTERPIFIDGDKLPLMICPAFENKKITVRVVARHNTSSEAEQMRIRINRQRENQVVDFNYSPITHMVINEELMTFLEIVHGMLKRNKPETPDFSDWFYTNMRMPCTIVTNVAGNHAQMVVPLKSSSVGIQFTEPFVAQVNKGQAYGQFEVEFSYTFYLNDFIGWDLEYPLNVYQEEIPYEYIALPQVQHQEEVLVRAAPEIEDMRAINPPTAFVQTPFYLKQPKHDPWAHPGQYWIQPILQARLTVDDVEEQVLCNIFDIPGFNWNPVSKAYLLRRHAVAFSHHDTPFLLQVWEGDRQVDSSLLRMDADGVVTLYKAPNLRLTYRIVITLDYAIRDYSELLWGDLVTNPEGWNLIFSIFSWFDFNQIPRPLNEYIHLIKKGIDKGWGKWQKPFNIYEMNLDFIAHNFNSLR